MQEKTALDWKKIYATEELLASLMALLKCNKSELLQKVEKLNNDLESLEKKIAKLRE